MAAQRRHGLHAIPVAVGVAFTVLSRAEAMSTAARTDVHLWYPVSELCANESAYVDIRYYVSVCTYLFSSAPSFYVTVECVDVDLKYVSRPSISHKMPATSHLR